MSARAQTLPKPDEQPAPPQEAAMHDTATHDPMIAKGNPALLARTVPAPDPLGAIKAMTDEEKIALFT